MTLCEAGKFNWCYNRFVVIIHTYSFVSFFANLNNKSPLKMQILAKAWHTLLVRINQITVNALELHSCSMDGKWSCWSGQGTLENSRGRWYKYLIQWQWWSRLERNREICKHDDIIFAGHFCSYTCFQNKLYGPTEFRGSYSSYK